MKYLYNAANKTIRPLRRGSYETNLTITESKFIEVMSNGKQNNWNEISKYVYDWTDNDMTRGKLRNLKSRLSDKLRLHFKTVPKVGYTLLDEIYIM